MNEIHNYIIHNKIIKDYFSKIPIEYRDDFIQHIWIIILELDKNKIQTLYDKGELGKFIIGIISNQLKSNTSSFYKQFRKESTLELTDNQSIENIADDEYREINNNKIIKDIIKILDNVHYVDQVLFKLYRGIDPITNKLVKPLTYSEIEKLTGITYQTVWYSVNKVTKLIKKQIEI